MNVNSSKQPDEYFRKVAEVLAARICADSSQYKKSLSASENKTEEEFIRVWTSSMPGGLPPSEKQH